MELIPIPFSMEKILFYLLLILATTSCSLLDGLEGDDPPCENIVPIDNRTRSAIPYQNGQVLRFEVSDGSSFMATVREQAFEPSRITGCEEEALIDFGGINVNNSLQVDINLFVGFSGLLFAVRFAVNGFPEISHDVELNAAGEVIGSFGSRVVSDTLLNGEPFRNVLAVDYNYSTNPSVRRSYYNVTSGFIGVELSDGTTIFLRE